MNLWTRFRSLHWGWQIVVVGALIVFYPFLLIVLPVAVYFSLKQKPRAYRLAGMLVAILPVFVFAAVSSVRNYDYDDIQRQIDELDSQKHGTELLVQKTIPPSGDTSAAAPAQHAEPAKTETPFERIVSIVGKYDEYPLISNLANINARNPQPPYEVIVVMENVKSCFSAKDKALNIMRDLYLDPIAGSAIVRVKAINNAYLSASLGANDARSVSPETWKGNGPTNFIKALQGGADYDMDDVQEATSRTVAGYTFAELSYECL